LYKLFIFSISLLTLSLPTLSAQSVQVSFEPSTSSNDLNTYGLDQASFSLNDRNATLTGRSRSSHNFQNVYSGSLSRNGFYAGVLHFTDQVRASILDGTGDLLHDVEVEYVRPDDGTLRLWVFNDGRFVTRDNVANFTFFETDGTSLYSHSNLSGSSAGEVASELAADPLGRTLLLYIPRINYESGEGSMVRIVNGKSDLKRLYESRDRQLKRVEVSDNGSIILLVTASDETRDEVILMDRFANEIIRFDSDENLLGATLSSAGRYITIWSESRVQVYEIATQERVGSSTLRQDVFHASYSEEDHQVLVLTGRNRTASGRIDAVGIQSIHLQRRTIARAEVNTTLAYLHRGNVRVDRTGDGAFEVSGLNRVLQIQTSF